MLIGGEEYEDEEDDDAPPPKTPRVYPDELPQYFDSQGYSFTARDSWSTNNGEGTTRSYSCIKWHTSQCKATATINFFDSKSKLKWKGEHTCQPSEHMSRETSTIIDLTKLMTEKVQEYAVTEGRTMVAIAIAKHVLRLFEAEYAGQNTTKLTIDQMKSLVYPAKNKEFGDWKSGIWRDPIRIVGDGDARNFIQFDVRVTLGSKGDQHIIGWAHPKLLDQMCDPRQIFVDGTWKVVPKGFNQCLIFMIYHCMYNLFIPIAFMLLNSKLQAVYLEALSQLKRRIIDQTGMNIRAITQTFDCEAGLGNAVREVLTREDGVVVPTILCNFHVKQAWYANAKAFHIPKEDRFTMFHPAGDCLFNTLFVIPTGDIEEFGIPWIRSMMEVEERENPEAFNRFYQYFNHTWMGVGANSPDKWNVEAIINDPSRLQDLINMTNNGEERYNRRVNAKFGKIKPTMYEFVDNIKQESAAYLEDMKNISNGSKLKPEACVANIPQIHPDYAEYRAAIATIDIIYAFSH